MTDQDHLIRLLAPIHHLPPSAQSPHGEAADELLAAITRERASWFARHRRLVVAVPTVAVAAALAVVVSAVLPTGSGPVGPAPAQALQISQDDRYITIKIRDTVADPQRYRAELAKYNLDVELILEPAAPDQVGRIIFSEEGTPGLVYLEAPGDCTANGNCSVGIKVPLTFKSYAKIVIGRTARPGEYVEGGSPEQNAEANALVGKTVGEALRILASRGETASYRVGWESLEPPAGSVPANWIVYDAAPLPDNVVALWVSADGKAPVRPSPTGSWSIQPSPHA